MKPTAPDAVRRKDSAPLRTRSAFVSRKIVFVRTVALLAGLIPALLRAEETIVDGVTWFYSVENGSATITGVSPAVGSLVIPSKVDELDVTVIGSSAFEERTEITAVTIPDSVTNIQGYAFAYCSGLKSVALSDSVKSIGGDAFTSCWRLEETRIAIADMTAWVTNTINSCLTGKRRLFFHGEELTAITIPDHVTNIGYCAFRGCSGLSEISFPDGLEGIDNGAFADCSGLTGAITIPSSVTSIGQAAFYNCPTITNVTADPRWASRFASSTNLHFSIPDGVSTIEWRAFENCPGLSSVLIPDSVNEIQSRAFYGCSNLTSVTIPDRVNEIPSYAFYGCSKLASVTIPAGVGEIDDTAFTGCDAVQTLVVSPETFDRFAEHLPGYREQMVSCEGLPVKIGVIPSTTQPYCVLVSVDGSASGELDLSKLDRLLVGIRSKACNGCSGLTSIRIPNGVLSIGADAFKGCPGLLDMVSIPGVQLVDGWIVGYGSTISNCPDLSGIRGIVEADFVSAAPAFSGCDSLQSVALPDGVPCIGGNAFSDCSHLTSISIPDSVTRIGSWAFYNCSGLTSMVIPTSVTRIELSAFYNCNGLKTLFLPFRFQGRTSSMGIPNGCTIRFYDRLCWLRVEAPIGGTTPSFGKTPFCPGDEVECLAPEIEVDPAVDGKRYMFRGWTGSGSVPATGTGRMASFRIEEDSTLVWDCGVQYRIEASVEEGGSTDFGSQWIDLGTTARVDVVSLWPDPFLELSGDVGGIVRSGTSLLVPADRPRSISVRVLSTGSDGSGKPLAWNAGSDWRAGTGESAGCYRSGEIGPSETSVLETAFSGRGIFSFDWRLSANRGHYGRVYLDGRLAGEMNYRSNSWTSVRWDLPPGDHTVRWAYEKGTTSATGEDALFLRDIRWLPRLSLTVGSDFGNARSLLRGNGRRLGSRRGVVRWPRPVLLGLDRDRQRPRNRPRNAGGVPPRGGLVDPVAVVFRVFARGGARRAGPRMDDGRRRTVERLQRRDGRRHGVRGERLNSWGE